MQIKLKDRHNLWGTRIYVIWGLMIQRCNNPKASGYKNYGGRGIKVCKRWRTFANFYKDMRTTYDKSLFLDRVDNNGDYCPENCRWTTRKNQNNNKRTCLYFEYKGKRQNLKQWSNELGIIYTTLQSRLTRYGWTIDRAFQNV